MTNSMCATTVHAIRDTELACLPAGLLNTIKMKQPRVVSRLIQVLGEKILGTYNRVSLPLTTVSTTMVTGEGELALDTCTMSCMERLYLVTVSLNPTFLNRFSWFN